MMSYITSTLSRLSLKAKQIQRLAAQCHTRKSPKRRVGNGASRQESNLDKAGLFHAGRGRRLHRAGFVNCGAALVGEFNGTGLFTKCSTRKWKSWRSFTARAISQNAGCP